LNKPIAFIHFSYFSDTFSIAIMGWRMVEDHAMAHRQYTTKRPISEGVAPIEHAATGGSHGRLQRSLLLTHLFRPVALGSDAEESSNCTMSTRDRRPADVVD
jgi:hypothetical protein